ncbi:sensor histidine kinase [Leptospira jelokensis]|uniref:histidine kinase n=1 Tax=Leptospira jelokensis TaxID=2484931 RepID=A0A4Z0ZY75_9LEPT|nr:sensor histidine kinase [Leptospira jelokensis]TGL64950.1 histidine kinase [Leptospira jelokensis]
MGFLLTFLIGCELPKSNQTSFDAKEGILDLSDASFDSEMIYPLAGEWKFYWKQWIGSEAIRNKETEAFIWKQSPSVWNDTLFGNETIESYGYATYELEIRLKSLRSDLAIFIPDIGTAYQLYVNGQILTSVGKIGITKNEVHPKYKPQIVLLPASKTYQLKLYVSNFHNRWGGYWYPILLGKAETIFQKKQRQIGFTIAVCIAAALMACYNIIFFYFRRTDITPLLFSLHCLMILFRALTTGERLGHLFSDSLSWDLLNRIEYFSVFLTAPVLYAFLYRIIPSLFWKRFGKYFNTPLYFMCLLALVAPNAVYAFFLNYIILYIYLTVVPIWFFILLKAVLDKEKDAVGLFVSYVAIMVANSNDTLVTFGIMNGPFLIPYSQIFLIFSHSIIISKRYSNSLLISEELSIQMKQLVVSTQKIMSSRDDVDAVKSALDILKSKIGNGESIYLYITNQSMGKGKVHSIDSGLRFQTNDFTLEDLKNLVQIELHQFQEPIVRLNRILIPFNQNGILQMVLDLPRNQFSKGESDLDWAKTIAYALVLSIQNLNRHDLEKYAVIGELSSEIAHDIGNHVMLIRKSLELLEVHSRAQEMVLNQTKQEIDVLSNLSVDILEFSKKNIVLDLKLTDINTLYLSIVDDLSLLFNNSRIQFRHSNSVSNLKIQIDSLRIRRLCINIAKNSLDLGSNITEFVLSLHSENSTLYLMIEDDGPGMSDEMKLRVLDSKIESKKTFGAGLGLSIVRKIVLAHGGELLLTDRPSGGLRFTILLPFTEQK